MGRRKKKNGSKLWCVQDNHVGAQQKKKKNKEVDTGPQPLSCLFFCVIVLTRTQHMEPLPGELTKAFCAKNPPCIFLAEPQSVRLRNRGGGRRKPAASEDLRKCFGFAGQTDVQTRGGGWQRSVHKHLQESLLIQSQYGTCLTSTDIHHANYKLQLEKIN